MTKEVCAVRSEPAGPGEFGAWLDAMWDGNAYDSETSAERILRASNLCFLYVGDCVTDV